MLAAYAVCSRCAAPITSTEYSVRVADRVYTGVCRQCWEKADPLRRKPVFGLWQAEHELAVLLVAGFVLGLATAFVIYRATR